MADRTVNININYKVNTADVTKAQQAAASAQKATEQLRKSTQQYGTDANKAGKQGADGLKQVSDSANKASQSTQTLSKQFGNLYTTIKAVIAAGVAREVVDIAINMARLAGQVEGVERAFKRTFPNSVQILDQLKRSTHGTITEFELMQRTLQATNLGVSVERLPELFEFAAVRAQQTGESVDYLVDSIVRGIGRKSPLILDNLGLSAIRLKEKFDGAALAAQSVGDVTEAVADIAREEMEKMGGYVTTGATKVDMLTVSWQELKTELSEKFDSSGVVSFLNEVVDGFREMIKSSQKAREETAQNAALIEFTSLKEANLNKDRVKSQQGLLDAIQQEINTRVELININNKEYSDLNEKFVKLRETHNVKHIEEMDGLKVSAKAITYKNSFYQETIKLLQAYLKELTVVNEAEKAPQTGIIERKQKQIEQLQEQIEKTNRLSDLGALGTLTKQLEIAQAELGDLLRVYHDFKIPEFKIEINDAAKSLTNMSEVIDRIEQQMAELATMKFPVPASPYTPTFWDKIGDEVKENWRDITSQGIDIQADQLKSLAESELQGLQARLAATREFYAEQQLLAGNNERAKAELRIKEERETTVIQRKIFEKEKSVRRAQAVIDGASGIIKAFATYPYPAAIVISALIAAQTASQLAIINRQQPRFAKGVIDLKGKGTGTSDSIDAKLSRGESVITAKRTQQSKGLLQAIQDGKISDKEISQDILNKLHITTEGVKYVGMDDSRIVNELRKQKAPDYMRHANLLFEVKTSTDGLHKRIRRKSMG
jgi:hypothetical protein